MLTQPKEGNLVFQKTIKVKVINHWSLNFVMMNLKYCDQFPLYKAISCNSYYIANAYS